MILVLVTDVSPRLPPSICVSPKYSKTKVTTLTTEVLCSSENPQTAQHPEHQTSHIFPGSASFEDRSIL